MLSHFSHVWLCATLWTVACQAPLSIGVSRQEYWSGLPFPPPEDLPNSEIEPASLIFPELAGGFSTTSITWKSVVLEFQAYQNFLESLLKHKLLGPTSRIFDAVNSCGVWEFASLTNCQGIVMLVKWKSLIRVQLFGTPWTIQSMGFSSPEYWSGWPYPSPGDLPNPGTSHCRSLHCRDHRTQVSCTTVRFFTSWATGEAQ